MFQSHTFSANDSIESVEASENSRNVVLQRGRQDIKLSFAAVGTPIDDPSFVSTKNQDELLADLTVAYSQGDFALLGGKGSGKTRVITNLCRKLGLDTETMVLYQV